MPSIDPTVRRRCRPSLPCLTLPRVCAQGLPGLPRDTASLDPLVMLSWRDRLRLRIPCSTLLRVPPSFLYAYALVWSVGGRCACVRLAALLGLDCSGSSIQEQSAPLAPSRVRGTRQSSGHAKHAVLVSPARTWCATLAPIWPRTLSPVLPPLESPRPGHAGHNTLGRHSQPCMAGEVYSRTAWPAPQLGSGVLDPAVPDSGARSLTLKLCTGTCRLIDESACA